MYVDISNINSGIFRNNDIGFIKEFMKMRFEIRVVIFFVINGYFDKIMIYVMKIIDFCYFGI